MEPYTSFAKTIRDLAIADLKNLRETSEGWYIEYKRESPQPAAIAKSISAFANTYGGWLFIGVQELSKEEPVAGSFPGVKRADVDPILQRIRKSVADHLNPTPHFETCVLWGPGDELDLLEECAVICIWVRKSSQAPHIHKSGQIYRRISDSSEPRAENDRFVLDQLWRRGEKNERQHKEWLERDPEFSTDEIETPYIRLMLIADKWSERDIFLDVGEAEIRYALSGKNAAYSLPFDTVHTSAEGYVARQLVGNSPNNLSLTWRLRHNLQADLLIPLTQITFKNTQKLLADFEGYEQVSELEKILTSYKKPSQLKIVDLNILFNVLLGIAETQERLCKLAGWTESYFLKIKLLNCWRTMPFVDVHRVLERFKSYGPPMCLDRTTSFPRGSGPNNYLEIDRYFDKEPAVKTLLQGLDLFRPIAFSYGIPSWIDYDENSKISPYYQELIDAGNRAKEAQRIRNRKAEF